MGKKKNKKNKRRHAIRSNTPSVNDQCETRKIKKAVIESSDEAEVNCVFGFACPDCSDLEFALAENALEFYQQTKQDALGFEVGHVLGAYYKYSTRKAYFGEGEEVCHISFCAKAKNNSVDDVPKKWLFAEFAESPKGYFVPSCVEILDRHDAEILYGCGFCPHHMLYPHPRRFVSDYGDDDGSIDAKHFCHYHKYEEEKGEKKNEKWSIKHEQIYYLECENTWVKVPR